MTIKTSLVQCNVAPIIILNLHRQKYPNNTQRYLTHVRTYVQLAETLLTVPGLVDASTGRMRGRLIPSQFEGRKASELKTDEYNLGECSLLPTSCAIILHIHINVSIEMSLYSRVFAPRVMRISYDSCCVISAIVHSVHIVEGSYTYPAPHFDSCVWACNYVALSFSVCVSSLNLFCTHQTACK